jgi:hypothetical protein
MTIVDILILTAAALAIIAVIGALGLASSRSSALRNAPTPLWFETEATRPGVR